MDSNVIIKELNNIANPAKAKFLQRFFKTGKGQYADGDIFLGITVPEQRKIAMRFQDVPLSEIYKLIKNKVHECRLVALEILVMKYEKAAKLKKAEERFRKQSKIVDFYLKNTAYINNWDLVDLSAPYILGDWLSTTKHSKNDRKILYKMASSKYLWRKRIAIVSTWSIIRIGDFIDTLSLAKIYFNDKEDLIHKATGWMLREVGKRSEETLTNFLDQNYRKMPRTMLRYAIERLSNAAKAEYMR